MGLPVAEAMACALPVIVTSYSAVAELVDDTVGYPVRVAKMIEVYDSVHFPYRGIYGRWAQPDFEHLRAQMRHVFEHRGEAREKGRRARERVTARWPWDHAAIAACSTLGIPA